MEGKSVLALARSNITIRKVLIFWMNFLTGLYLGDLMLCCSPLLLSAILLYGSCRNICRTCIPSPLSKCAVLCVCGHWSTTGPQLKPRDKNIIAVSAGRKRIRLLQIGPLRILTRQTCEAHAVLCSSDGEDFCEVAGRRFSCSSRSTALLEALTDKNKRKLWCNSHCIFTQSVY